MPSCPFSSKESLFTVEVEDEHEARGNDSDSDQVSYRNSLPLLTLPAAFYSREHGFKEISRKEPVGLKGWLSKELDVSRLNEIQNHLWLAGLERPARQIHEQILMGREVVITEKADIHLTWHGSKIYMKPLPEFLLCQEMWEDFLCRDPQLFANALGFLWSYVCSIRTKTDLDIGHRKGLVPGDVLWVQWTSLCRAIVRNIDHDLVNPRYRHGELRVYRLNWIYRICSRTRGPGTLLRGYMFIYGDYATFFQRNTAALVGALLYIAVVLSAMQVGLNTSELNGSKAFQRASFVFSIFSILAPLIVISIVALIMLLAFILNFRYSISERNRRVAKPALESRVTAVSHRTEIKS
ncbi:MAG: hypothetical protein Q9163_003024 [Psora crenata]